LYKIFDEAVNLIVKTKRPQKWILIDKETGEVYQGNPEGYWDKMEIKVRENNE
jgi:hypothetical protein